MSEASQEILPENRHPVNLVAKQWLRVVGQLPNPRYQYSLQLLEWGMQQEPEPPPLHSLMQEQLESLLYRWPPAEALGFLLHGPDAQPFEADNLDAESLRQVANPLEAAHLLRLALYDRMQSEVPGFPPPTS